MGLVRGFCHLGKESENSRDWPQHRRAYEKVGSEESRQLPTQQGRARLPAFGNNPIITVDEQLAMSPGHLAVPQGTQHPGGGY